MLTRITAQHLLRFLENPAHIPGKSLHTGDILWGRVLERHSDTEITLLARGIRSRAQTALPLAVGKQYQFLVQQKQPQLILQVLDSEEAKMAPLLSAWRTHTSTRNSLAQLLQQLGSVGQSSAGGKGEAAPASRHLSLLLPTLVCNGMESLEPLWLARQLSSCGLFWESKVARWLRMQGPERASQLVASDLKGALLTLKRGLARPARETTSEDVGGMTAQALKFVESHQQLNLLSRADSGYWFWFIPGSAKQELSSVEISLREDEDQEGNVGKTSGFRLKVRVVLSRLGPVEATMSLNQEKISCQIRVDDESLAGWISPQLPLLGAALESRGFQVDFLGCEVGTLEGVPPSLAAYSEVGSSLLHLVV